MSIDVFAAADAAVEGLRPAIAARQNAYAAEHGGRYWQGLRSHGSPPPDGALWHATVGSAVPTDQLMEWPAVIHDHALPVALTVDVYDGPAGQGYVLRSEVEVAGTTYHKADVFGPETWRAFDWTPTPSALSGVSIGTPTASATYNSILVDLPLTEAGGELSGAALRYRPAGELAWRDWLPLHPLRPGGEPSRLQGSLIDLTPGTAYDLEITVSDDLNGLERVTLQAATRADDAPSHADLWASATHFVRPDGNDSNPGTSNTPSGAWQTLLKVRQSAPSGAVVGIAPGHYPGLGLSTLRQDPITLVAQYPSVDDAGGVANAGNHSVIDGNLSCGPSNHGVSGIAEAPWEHVQITGWNGGQPGGQTYTVWRWTGAWGNAYLSLGSQVAANGAFCSTRDGEYQRIWFWKNQFDNTGGADPDYLLGAPNKWIELLHENATWNYGAWKDPSTDDIYVRMADDADPNDYWWTFGHNVAFGVNAADCRFSGLVWRGWYCGLRPSRNAHRLHVDHNWFNVVTYPMLGLSSGADKIDGSNYPEDIVFERNLVLDSGLSLGDGRTTTACPWSFVKVGVELSGATVTHKPGGIMEGMAIRVDGARRLVARHNTVVGAFNGASIDNVGARTRFSGSEWDVIGNLFRGIADDPIEPPTAGSWRVLDNRAERSTTWMSAGPNAWGPSYWSRNVVWRCGTRQYAADWADGRTDPYVASINFKYSGGSDPQTKHYVWNNTFWSDAEKSSFGDPTAAGGGNTPEWLVLWNNVFRFQDDCLSVVADQYTADYNQYGAPASTSRGFRVLTPSGAVRRFTFADYRTLCPDQDAHSNVAIPDHTDLETLDAQFVDAQGGDLRLVAESVLRGVGVAVPGLIVGGADLGAADEVARLRPL